MIDPDAVEEIAKNEAEDEILETLAGTCRILLNPYWESYVHIEQYEALVRGEAPYNFLCSRAPSNLQEWTTRKSK